MQPDHVCVLVTRFASPDASSPDLFDRGVFSHLVCGFFLSSSDLAHVSVRHKPTVISATHMTSDIPKSKLDQEGLGHTTRIARNGGPACSILLTERPLTLGAYIRTPRSPVEDVGPFPLQKIGGHACTIALTKQLLTLGAYIRIFPFPAEDVGPLLCKIRRSRLPSSVNGTATTSRCSALGIDAGSCHIPYGSEATEQRRRLEYP